jgi:hypothetical protein
MDLREIGCEDGRWIELAQDRFQCWALVLKVLNQGNSYFVLVVNIRASGTATGCRRLHPYRRITSLLSALSHLVTSAVSWINWIAAGSLTAPLPLTPLN